jgi:ElaB/YqjD/DUF883 family membrane-anchored ribosome-binding protein
MAIKVPILSEWNPKGIDRAKADFAKLEKTSEKVGFAMKKAFLPATAALGALTAAAGASLKAAVEDAAQQEELARQIQAVTGATDEAVAANEEFIAQMELTVAVSDAQLRPALGNLVRATNDVAEAQYLLGIALDISAATGKDLNTVSEALAKAYQGETSSLKRLDPSLTAVIKSGADFNEIGEKLADTFGGAAADAANTAEGRFKRMQIQIDNAQESIGYALLPILEKMIPVLESVATFVGDNTELVIAFGAAVGVAAGIIVAYNTALKLKTAALGIAKAAQFLFNKTMEANPAVRIAMIILTLVGVLFALEKKFGVVTKVLEAGKIVMDALGDAARWLAGKFVDFINTLIDVANKIPFVSIDKLTNVFEEQAAIVDEELTPAIEGYGEAELELAEMIAEAAYQQQLANIDYSEAERLMSELHPTIEDLETAIAKTNKEMEEHHKAQQFISDMNTDLIREFDLLFRTYDNQEAVNGLTDALAEAAGVTAEFGENSREAAEANAQVRRELANVINQLDNIPAVTQAQMLLDIERGELDRVMQDIAVFQHMADTAVKMLTSSQIASAAGMVSGGNFTPAAAVPTPLSSTQIGTKSGMKDSTVNIYMPAGTDSEEVSKAIQKATRDKGALVATTTGNNTRI